MSIVAWAAAYVAVAGLVGGFLCEAGFDYVAVPVSAFWPLFLFVPVGGWIARRLGLRRK